MKAIITTLIILPYLFVYGQFNANLTIKVVRLDSGQPIPGASLYISGHAGSGYSTTDKNGEVSISYQEKYSDYIEVSLLDISAQGYYPPQKFRDPYGGDTMFWIRVIKQNPTQTAYIRLEPASRFDPIFDAPRSN